MNKLKYVNYGVVFQEVPNEITLAINISNCPYKCKGCHSDYLWKNIGNYIDNDIDKLLNKYDEMITCVCFMGGDQEMEDLIELLKKIKRKGLKTALYTGADDISVVSSALPYLNFIKIGSYKENLGGLNSKTTNQKFYEVIENNLIDKTYLFQKHYKKE